MDKKISNLETNTPLACMDYIKNKCKGSTVVAVPKNTFNQYVEYFHNNKYLSDNFNLYYTFPEDNEVGLNADTFKNDTNDRVIFVYHNLLGNFCKILKRTNVHIDTLIIDEVQHFGKINIEDIDVDNFLGFSTI